MEEWYAKNTSAACEKACDDLEAARDALQQTLIREYPRGADVRVVHYHGSYTGEVVGWDYSGCRVEVRNHVTGKTKKWWSRHVELLQPNDQIQRRR